MRENNDPETSRSLGAVASFIGKNTGSFRLISIIVCLALVLSSAATIIILSGYGSREYGDVTTAVWLLNLDLILALTFIAIMARRIVTAWISRRRSPSGSTLHIRLVASFSLVAVIPALLVAIFSGLFLNFGIESWFSDRVRTAINESKLVAEAYLQEHQKNIAGSALGMANDVNRAAQRFLTKPRILREVMARQVAVRELSEAVLIDNRGNTVARAGLGFSLGFNFSSDDFLKGVLNGRPGEVVIISARDDDKVVAGVKLESFTNLYLLVGRFVKPEVLEHLSRTRGATAQYTSLEVSRESLQIKFLIIFGMVAIILLLAAIWIGWSLATQISTPIGSLIGAAEQVRNGNLQARVAEVETQSEDEIGVLNRTFNRMTDQLETQRNGLMEANRELDERRQFTETVLAGVSAGVIGLDSKGKILLSNRSASELLNIQLADKVGQNINDVIPEMGELLSSSELVHKGVTHAEIDNFGDSGQMSLVVSLAIETIEGEVIGHVITFDDITELLSAQRKAAWADVARRIAHEIKNPLTPIQLSAERLHRKYSDEPIKDKATFLGCTDTIIRQVKDIGRMVDEFSSFARMPQPNLKPVDIAELCRQSCFSEQTRFPNIDYKLSLPDDKVLLNCDSQQIGQVLTNLLKNSAEAINERSPIDADAGDKGCIDLNLMIDTETLVVGITDNGIGLPDNLIDRITEPYVTTREKGTGLGLAIAKKIMEDHQGDLILRNNTDGGAKATLIFKLMHNPSINSAG